MKAKRKRLPVLPAMVPDPETGEPKPLRVLNPRTMRPIRSDKPTFVPQSTYWCRRILVGDVLLAEKAPPKAKPKKKTAGK